RGDYGQAIEGARLGRGVAQLPRDLERRLVPCGGRTGGGAKADDAELVERLQLAHTIPRPPRRIERCLEILFRPTHVARAPPHLSAFQEQSPERGLMRRVEAELPASAERRGVVRQRRLDRVHERRRGGGLRVVLVRLAY